MANDRYEKFIKPLSKRIHSRKPFWRAYLIGNALELRYLADEIVPGEKIYTIMPCTWRPVSVLGRHLFRNFATVIGLILGGLFAFFTKSQWSGYLIDIPVFAIIFAVLGSLIASSGAIMVITDKKALLLDINPLGAFFRKSRRAIPWSKTTAPNIDSVGFFSKLSIPTASDDDDNIRVTGLWGRDGDFLYKAVLAAQEAHGAVNVSSKD